MMDINRQRAMFKLILDILKQNRSTLSVYSKELYQKITESGLDISQDEMHKEFNVLERDGIIKIAKFFDSDGHVTITLLMPGLLD